jgi:hypothetical protein
MVPSTGRLRQAASSPSSFFTKVLTSEAEIVVPPSRAAELFDDRTPLPGGDALHVHLLERQPQRLLTPLVALEQRRLKPAGAIPGNRERERADAGHPLPGAIPSAPPRPTRGPLEGLRPHAARELAVEHIVHHGGEHLAEHVVGGGLLFPPPPQGQSFGRRPS